MGQSDFDIIIIGGSAGSMGYVTQLVAALPEDFAVPVVIVMHRLRNVASDMSRIIAEKKKVREPEDKEFLQPGMIYLAPQNYHLLLETDGSFALDYSELVNYSRPSIDVTFRSGSEVYGKRTLVILLSGANSDGASGVVDVLKNGGKALVQDPEGLEFKAMPVAALAAAGAAEKHNIDSIIQFILKHCK